MKEQGFQLSGLHSSGSTLYESLGYHSVDKCTCFLKRNNTIDTIEKNVEELRGRYSATQYERGDIVVRPADFRRDLRWMMESYADYARNFNGPIVRKNPKYWSEWIKDSPHTKYFVIEGYTLVSGEQDEKETRRACIGLSHQQAHYDTVLEIKDFFTTEREFNHDRGKEAFDIFDVCKAYWFRLGDWLLNGRRRRI